MHDLPKLISWTLNVSNDSYKEDINFEVKMIEKSGNDASRVKIRPVCVVPPNNHLPVETITIDD